MTVHVLLTGASRGIGRAAAELLARDTRLVGQATRPGAGLLAADFADPDAPQALWQEALDRLDGRIDVVINNAGLFEANDLDRPHDDWVAGWEHTLRINLTAAAELSALAVRHWRERGSGGRLLNVSSRAAYRGDSPAHWHYAAAKAGMVAMTKSIARGYAREAILAFAICPGYVMTGMAEEYLSSRGGEQLLADIPLGRVAEPGEIATIIRFCALEAPPSMTGAVLDANGASYVR